MTIKQISRILFYALLLNAAPACKPKEKQEQEEVTENPNPVDFKIMKTDSGLQVEVINYTFVSKDSFQIVLNGETKPFMILNSHEISLPGAVFSAGKNSMDLIYFTGRNKDTVHKTFINPVNIAYDIVGTYRHNNRYFTQGLLFDETGKLIESTGMTGESKILFYNNYRDGSRPVDSIVNEPQEFGEGISIVDGQLVQLLWKNMYIKVYDKATRKLSKKIHYSLEGWGICYDGKTIYTSDGSSNISMVDISGDAAQVLGWAIVQDERGKVPNLNELEWVDGKIFANVWQSDIICIIDPLSGDVLGKIDLSPLTKKELAISRNIDVLNGIAYDKNKGTLLLTGKYWSHFYEIKLKTAI